GDDRLDGGPAPDRLAGAAGTDRLTGGSGADRLRGDGGGDTVEGGAGNDDLGGGAGDDLLVGGEGGDVLRGGAGDDRIDASERGSGKKGDTVPGTRDEVDCGPGQDVAVLDAADRQQGNAAKITGCETVIDRATATPGQLALFAP
ncbi:MAG: calcium-binding protein, partial [Solirubrobacterales bacterium]|nr:calcium-binding protein [Solirubrobacterales bacterium]